MIDTGYHDQTHACLTQNLWRSNIAQAGRDLGYADMEVSAETTAGAVPRLPARSTDTGGDLGTLASAAASPLQVRVTSEHDHNIVRTVSEMMDFGRFLEAASLPGPSMSTRT